VDPGDLVLAGKVTGCFGIRGYLKLELSGRDPDRARTLRRVFVGASAATAAPQTIADVKLEGGKVLVLFEGHTDRTSAERLRGSMLFVAAADAAPPPEGGHYIHDLIGCEVRTLDGRRVGRIEDVFDVAGRDLWSVRDGDVEHLIPAEREFVVSVDTGKKEVVVDLPEGLLG
jgi:16S rRNA processing protein RimM